VTSGATGRHEYQVLARRERMRSRVFTVVTDSVSMPGDLVSDRDYLLHPGAVGVVALDADDRVALIYQYRHPVRTRLWELPAGLLDVPGENLVVAAARELAEEVDLVARRWDLLTDVHVSPGCSNEVIRLYLARELSSVPPDQRHTRDAEEAELQLRWFDLDQAVEMVLAGEISNAACVTGVLAAQASRSKGWSTLRAADEPLVRPETG
jgi:8-oxo-dGDP phosphatase